MISVIVPIYNIEDYVHKCLDSLIAQTVTDVEFIIIDDGSTDHSREIVDGYKKDTRFHIIHTENRGLSAARNLGIDMARGDWLMFIDGDDYVANDFCKTPYQKAIEYEADLVIFNAYAEKKGRKRKTINRVADIFLPCIVDASTAFEISHDYVWNKMYNRKLFNSVRYPEGRNFEDIATTHKLLFAANRILAINDCLYYHIYRRGSIFNTWSYSNSRDSFISNLERYNNMTSYGYSEEKLFDYLCGSAIGFRAHTNYGNDELYKHAEKILNSTKEIPDSLSYKQKVALAAWKIDKRLFCFLGTLLGRLKLR